MTYSVKKAAAMKSDRLTAIATTCFHVNAHSLQGRTDGIEDDYDGNKNSRKEIFFGVD